MRIGDLVRREGQLAIVLEIVNSNGYTYPRFVYLKGDGKVRSCSVSLLEVVSESR